MSGTVRMLFGLAGGLALFLYGMNSMSRALQQAAGPGMKAILAALTKTPFTGMAAGALVTAVLQSSSATTVMAISFVSAGLMTLPQAVSVIFGANVGTTVTTQLTAFDISDAVYPLLFLGVLVQFLAREEKQKSLGLALFAFGLLFEGLGVMGAAMEPLAQSPVFPALMDRVAGCPALGILLGAGMTLLVQSSSASIAVLQSVAARPGPDGVTSLVGLAGAIPILLGNNIGTTITALLAALGQPENARRAALAHTIFNVSGSAVAAFFLPAFARFVTAVSPKGAGVEVIARQIANAHTLFNLACALVWLPLLPLMVKLVTVLVPESPPCARRPSCGKSPLLLRFSPQAIIRFMHGTPFKRSILHCRSRRVK